MDSKGEMIYRNRPYFYVLEEMTRWMFKQQKLRDDIPEAMIAHSVCIAAKSRERYPPHTTVFLKENYVPIAFRLLVTGKILTPYPADKAIAFNLAIPAEYALVWQSANGTALLDGLPYTAPRRLNAGTHTLQVTQGDGEIAIIWAKAVQCGFSPFYKPSKEENWETHQAVQDNIF